MTDRPRAALAMSPDTAKALLDSSSMAALREVCDIPAGPVLDNFHTDRARHVLSDVEVLVTGWGCPPLDADMLDSAPRLRAVVHTAGTVRPLITDACWERGIEVCSAAAANAIPVAEYTVAMILLSGKRALERAEEYRRERTGEPILSIPSDVGNFRRSVGIVSASLIGRRVIELLRAHDLTVSLYDPYISAADVEALGVRAVGIDELFRTSDVVSIHAPLLPETRGMVDRRLLRSMRPNATLLNTARGAIIDQDALVDVLRSGHIRAVLDVTDPDVLPPEHPLWDCDNLLITPHLAGSQGNEWRRLVELAVAEIRRFAAGLGFAHPVHREQMGRTA